MIIQSDSVKVETNIKKSERSAFGIKADGKLFQILTKNLYSNPILGTLQELGQNCFDSLARAGKSDKPFTVTLPSYLSPQLVLRDEGIGMTHEFMMERYCVAFDSTKDTDANQAGGYGIGKLIALALSTTYSIACYENGKRRSYSVFMNGEGLPEIIHTNTRDTTEPDGIEVTVPVLEKDISAFADAAQRAYKYYNPQPIIRGSSGFKFTPLEKLIEGKNWWLDKNLNFPVAVGGIYWYKIEPRDIPGLTQTQIDFLGSNLGLTMVFGPSEITPQTNRQGLNYDDKTINAIKNRLSDIESGIKNVIQADFDKCNNITEAKLLYRRYFTYDGAAYTFGRVLGKVPSVTWKNHEINDGYFWFGKQSPSDKNKHIWLDGVSSKTFTLNWGRGGYRVKQNENELRVLVDNENKIFINDLEGGRGIKYRVGNLLKKAGSGSGNMVYTAIRFRDKAAEKSFHDLNGTDSSLFTLASTIVINKEEVAAMTSGNEKHRLKVFKFIPDFSGARNSYRSNQSDWWEPTEIDVDEGGVYLQIYRFEPHFCGESNSNLNVKINTLLSSGLIKKDIAIYGIKHSEIKTAPILEEVRESSDWIDWNEWIKAKREEITLDKNLEQAIVDSTQTFNIKGPWLKMDAKSDEFIKYKLACQFISDQTVKADKQKDLQRTYTSLGGNIANSSLLPTHNLAEMWERVIRQYPLLDKLSPSYNVVDTTLAKDYIKMVDFAESARKALKEKNLSEECVTA